MWFKAKGVLVYDPKRPGLKKKTDWWAVVNTDNEICRYYRWWVEKNPQAFGLTNINIQPPSWGAHVSVIRGEQPTPDKMHLWKKYHGEQVEFKYSHNVRQSGDTTGDRPGWFFFVEVDCPRLLEIRRELNRPTNWKLHMTIGRIYE